MNGLFKNLDEQQRQILIKDLEGTIVNVEANTSIKSLFKLSFSIGIVLQGLVRITRNDYSGTKYLISILHEDQLFGPKFIPLINDDYDIETAEKSKILILDYRAITAIHNQNSEIHQQFKTNLLDMAAEIINDANERITIISQRSIRDKLIEYFEIAFRKSLSRNIYLPFSYKDLASYLAIDRSAMMREIKHLKDEKIISTKGRKIVLLYK